MDKIKTFKTFSGEGKDNTFGLIVDNYTKLVKKELIRSLIKKHNLIESDAIVFVNKIFKSDIQTIIKLRSEIEDFYSENKTPLECSNFIIKKYYKRTVLNNFPNMLKQVEVTGINERFLYKKTGFFSFIEIIKNIGLSFKLDISIIDNYENSLNKDGFILYLETDKILKNEFIKVIKHRHIFSFIEDKLYSNEISFYIGIKNDYKLSFGIKNNDTIDEIGYYNYNNMDLLKLPLSNVNNVIFNRFKLKVRILTSLKEIFKNRFNQYEDVNIFMNILEGNFVITIETYDGDIINKNYIKSLFNDIDLKYLKFDYNIIEKQENKKLVFQIEVL